jgi:hypothetical protein
VTAGRAALLLGLLLLSTLYFGARKFGWIDPPPAVTWKFRNHLLEADLNQRLFLRPMSDAESAFQIWISHVDAEPRTDLRETPLAEPYVAFSIAERGPRDPEFLALPPGAVPLRNLGALTVKEWIESIGPVREKLDGGGTREVLRLRCGQELGGAISYYFDPDRPVVPFGWFRQEVVPPAEGTAPKIYFARRTD